MKTLTIGMRVTEKEKRLLERAAKVQKVSLSNFLRHAVERAEHVVARHKEERRSDSLIRRANKLIQGAKQDGAAG